MEKDFFYLKQDLTEELEKEKKKKILFLKNYKIIKLNLKKY